MTPAGPQRAPYNHRGFRNERLRQTMEERRDGGVRRTHPMLLALLMVGGHEPRNVGDLSKREKARNYLLSWGLQM